MHNKHNRQNKVNKFRINQSGQAIVEYVIILAVFIIAVIGFIPSFQDSIGNAYIKSEGTVTVGETPAPSPDVPEITPTPAPTYVVKYDANGGTGAPGDQTKQHDVDLILSSVVPVRTGYTFKGWSVSRERANAGTIDYNPGGTYNRNEDITLYASWDPITFTVKYDANGGKGAPGDQIKKYDVDLTLSSVKPTREGYTFKGWSTTKEKADKGTIDYNPGGTYTKNEDVTLYASWSPVEYKVMYDANGGKGAPDDQTKKYNVDLTLSSVKPTRTGYTFKGWSTSKTRANNGTIDYNPGGKYTKNEDITLYASWTPVEYTVKYNANGGTGAPEDQIKKYDVDLTLRSEKPTRTGYTFKGWSTTKARADAGTVDYNPGGKYTKNEDMTLYASWTPITYTVQYNANGGTGAPGNQTKKYDVDLTLSSVKPTRSGYTFNGWSTSKARADAGTIDYNPGSTYTKNADMTLYASWTPITYTVQYNANGGSGAPGDQTKKYDVDLTLSSVKPTRTGYTFNGWSTTKARADNGNIDYNPGGTYNKNADMTLYASWTPITYTVQYNANGGSGAPGDQIKKYDVDLTLSSVKPTRTGYTFNGWSTTKARADNGNIDYNPGGTYNKNADMTLYASWTPITYTVQYNANGGTGAPGNQIKEYNVDLTLSSVKPTRTGYTFNGWSTTKARADNGTVDYNPGGTYTKNADMTLYASWTPISYTVKYDANGGTGAPGDQTKQYNVNLTLSSTKPTRTGYTFNGWSTSKVRADAGTIDYNPGGSYTKNADMTLYASWAPISYVVKYDANGGTGAPGDQTKQYNVTLTLSSVKPTRSGYTFNGWSTSKARADAGTIDYNPGGSYTKNADMTLYASWSPVSYVVKYNANGGTGAPGDQTKYYDVTLTLSSVKPTRTGYTFNGWSTSKARADAGNIDYNPGGTYTKNADLTLYASWTPISYVVKYDANGGTGAPEDQIKYYNVTLTLSSVKPTRNGYTFNGWSTTKARANNGTIDYNPGGSYTKNEDMTLYASWTPIKYTVTYHANGGSGTVPAQASYSAGETVTVQNATLTMPDHQFAGWSTNSSSKLVDYRPGNTFTMPARNVDLYAVYMLTEYPYNGTDGPDGTIQEFTAPVDGTYQIQLWGARGGTSCNNGVTNPNRPNGGYTTITVTLTKGQTIYFAVGGHGADNNFARSTSAAAANPGGWNGGGNGFTDAAKDEGGNFSSSAREGSGGGGGATSAYTAKYGDGQLVNYSSHKGDILGVAGGGAGANYTGTDGYGGGNSGGNSPYNGTQTSGYAFGKGESATSYRRIS